MTGQQNDKFPGLSQPNPSYHGVVFADACGEAGLHVTKIRCDPLMRDLGANDFPVSLVPYCLQGLETLSLRVERHVGKRAEGGGVFEKPSAGTSV